MSSDIALILHVLQAQGSSHVTSPSTPPPPPPRMVEGDTFPGSSGEYSNVYDYPPPPSHLPPAPSSEVGSFFLFQYQKNISTPRHAHLSLYDNS